MICQKHFYLGGIAIPQSYILLSNVYIAHCLVLDNLLYWVGTSMPYGGLNQMDCCLIIV